MEFYWEEIDNNFYVLYQSENAYPLLELYWCEDCQCYHCESETFDFYEDYDCEEQEIENEEELLELVKEDLIESLKEKINYIIELIRAIDKME